MLGAVAINWTDVLIVGVPAYIAAIGGAVAAVLVALNRRDLKTPSGDRIGHVTERTHDITHATNVLVRKVNGYPADTLKPEPADA